ncbi:MAG TPA: molecular chaperone SurA [Pseudomonas sabulinigri]|uniref:PpiC domain-containing protein n=1 Tax=marine sediment metagenome TaxID=412755 RepID=A0A0F9VVH9_9ZZZZ|nr:molecular chaperone SurA [Halopseudomonas sabulinigri]HEC51892.1 molecular chaperone SurA [Halopseudomonas sabulinigri]
MHCKFIPAVFSLCAAMLFGTAAQAEVVPLDRVAAIVDSDVVMVSQVKERIQAVRQQLRQNGTELPPEDQLQSQVVDRLVLESIQLQMGERAGIRIDDGALNQAMQQIAARNNVTLDQFRAALERDGISYNQAREQIRREMIINRVRQRRVRDTIQVTDQEVRNFLSSEVGRYQTSADFRLAMIVLPLAESASPADVEKAAKAAGDIYQQLNQGADFNTLAASRSAGDTALEGGELGWRKAAQLPGPFANAVSQLDIGQITQPMRSPAGFHILKLLEKRGGEGQLVQEFNVRHILIKPSEIRSEGEAAQLSQRLYDRIAAGESFAELAKSYSEDPGSALNGGDLNWVTADALAPEFAEVMTSLPENQVSVPFQSQYGWHILEVTGEREVDMTDEMREQQARNLIQSRKYEEELQSWLLKIRDEAYVETKI